MAVVEVEDDEVRVVGQSGGTTTITATFGTLTATADITVVSGVVLNVGTVVWSAVAPGLAFDHLMKASPVDSTNFSYFASDTTAGVTVGLDIFGRETARYPLTSGSWPAMPHAEGGFLVWGLNLERIPPLGGRPWTYAFPYAVSNVLQRQDGTIYVVYGGAVDVLDGATGGLIAREFLPTGLIRNLNVECTTGNHQIWDSLETGMAAMDNEGRLRVPFITRDGYYDHLPCLNPQSAFESRVGLLTMNGGSPSYTNLATMTDPESFYGDLGLTLADDDGGVMVGWTRSGGVGEGAYVNSGVVPLASSPYTNGLVDLETETIYGWSLSGLTAFDSVDNSVRWVSSTTTVDQFLGAMTNGTLAARDSSTGMVYHFDSSGNATAVGAVNADWPAMAGDGSYIGLQGSAVVNVENVHIMPVTSFAGGAPARNGCKPSDMAPYSDQWKGLTGGGNYTYGFIGAWPKFQWAVRKAFFDWTWANTTTLLNTSYEFTASPTPNIELERVAIPPKPDGTVVGGSTNAWPNSSGIISSAKIYFNTDPYALTSDTGYLKVALHEIGHTLGLDDAKTLPKGRSVMNLMAIDPALPPALGKPNDQGGNLPVQVMRCDAQRAYDASLRSWP